MVDTSCERLVERLAGLMPICGEVTRSDAARVWKAVLQDTEVRQV
jgi:hypothetical protein